MEEDDGEEENCDKEKLLCGRWLRSRLLVVLSIYRITRISFSDIGNEIGASEPRIFRRTHPVLGVHIANFLLIFMLNCSTFSLVCNTEGENG
jgi:hypothetical protein